MRIVIFGAISLLFVFICSILSSKAFNKADEEAFYKLNRGHDLLYDTIGCILLVIPPIGCIVFCLLLF